MLPVAGGRCSSLAVATCRWRALFNSWLARLTAGGVAGRWRALLAAGERQVDADGHWQALLAATTASAAAASTATARAVDVRGCCVSCCRPLMLCPPLLCESLPSAAAASAVQFRLNFKLEADSLSVALWRIAQPVHFEMHFEVHFEVEVNKPQKTK